MHAVGLGFEGEFHVIVDDEGRPVGVAEFREAARLLAAALGVRGFVAVLDEAGAAADRRLYRRSQARALSEGGVGDRIEAVEGGRRGVHSRTCRSGMSWPCPSFQPWCKA